MTFQQWAQSLDPKVWAKNDIAYAKLAWDEGRVELESHVVFQYGQITELEAKIKQLTTPHEFSCTTKEVTE